MAEGKGSGPLSGVGGGSWCGGGRDAIGVEGLCVPVSMEVELWSTEKVGHWR